MRGSIEPPEFASSTGATLHLWSSDDAWTSFTAHSDPDGAYSGTLSLKTGGFEVGFCLGERGVPFRRLVGPDQGRALRVFEGARLNTHNPPHD
jgi:hypothetical protein